MTLRDRSAALDQGRAQPKSRGSVHAQQGDGGAPARRGSLAAVADERQLQWPTVTPGMEEPLNVAGQRIDGSDVWTFESIAFKAGEGEVSEGRRAPVLLGDDVVRFSSMRSCPCSKPKLASKSHVPREPHPPSRRTAPAGLGSNLNFRSTNSATMGFLYRRRARVFLECSQCWMF